MEHIALGMKRDTALSITGLTRHQYYYKPRQGKPGVKPTGQVKRYLGNKTELCSNEVAIRQMQEIQFDDDLRCGHRRMTNQLQLRGFIINHKKVYRLMKQHHLLLPKQDRASRDYVTYRIIAPTQPLSHLEDFP